MQFEALKIFCDVVRRASFSRGAAENGVSQSTASQAVHNLEDRLGVKLIDRSKRPLKPTPHGKIYYEGCLELVERYQEVERRVRALGREDQVEGVVRVAAIYSVGLSHLTRHIAEFRDRHSLADCRLECMHPLEVVDHIRSGRAELGIVSFPKKWPGLDVVPWREEEMVLVVPPGHPMAEPGGIPVGRLDGVRFVHYIRELPIRRAIDRHLKRRGVQVETGLEFDSIENIKRAVEVGAGVAILPRTTLDREVASGSLVAVPLSDHPLSRPLAIIHRGEATLGLAGARFLRALRDDSTEGMRAQPSSPAAAAPAAGPSTNGRSTAPDDDARASLHGRASAANKS